LVWLINVFFALLGRMAPKMNVFFSIGLTANSAAGLYIFAVAMPWILIAHTEAMKEAVRNMARMVEAVR
jgi:flagellar biosynthesis protein FliR